jgi:hypothetical protein
MSRNLTRYLASVLFGLPFIMDTATAAGANLHSVAELFTSQGCSSCPPADRIAGQLLHDPQVLVLSFHVNYWDDLGWKDTFSSLSSTERQYAYAQSLRERSVFTPQLVVNGTQSLVGSQQARVEQAVAAATGVDFPIQAQLSAEASGSFKVTFVGPPTQGDVFEVRYVHRSVIRIPAGENRGRDLETFNNVTQLRRIGSLSDKTLELAPLSGPNDGIAVLVQAPQAGRILGAAAYLKPAAGSE